MDGEKRLKLQNILRLQQQLLKKVIDESGRDLATNYADLFTRTGQLKEDVKKKRCYL